MKKITSVFLIFSLALTFFMGTAFAAPPEYTGTMDDSFAVMLIDSDTGTVLFQNNEDERVEPASTTKIMTCMLAIEKSDLDATVTISKKAANTGGSTLGIRTGEEIRMYDLLTGMMLASGNDASIAVAENISGSVEDFAALMNEKAKSLGMDSTNFVTPNGLHDENHFTTASDMAKLARYAMQNQTFRDIIKKVTYDMPKTEKQKVNHVKNTNWLIEPENNYYYEYANGIKTGSTPYAGGCLVSSASKGGMNLICLVFREKPSEKTKRWTISKELFEWGFNNYKTKDVSSFIEPVGPVQVQDYSADDVKDGLLEFKQPEAGKVYATLSNEDAQKLNSADTIEAVTEIDEERLVAPIAEGDIMGKVTYKIKASGEEIYSYNLIASRDIPKAMAGGPSSPVVTMKPSESPKHSDDNNSLYIVFLIAIPGGLIVFLIVRMVMARRSRFRRRRRPHYSYRK